MREAEKCGKKWDLNERQRIQGGSAVPTRNLFRCKTQTMTAAKVFGCLSVVRIGRYSRRMNK